jgi:hypothetical protein
VQSKKAFSKAPHELASKWSEEASNYSKSHIKEAMIMVASLHGLRLVPVGIALKTPEPARAVTEVKQKARPRTSPSEPSLNQLLKSNPQYVALEEERRKVISDLKDEVGGTEAQGSLKVSLQDLSQRVKTLKAQIKEEASSRTVQKAT